MAPGAEARRRVFVFLDTMPQRQGSGASLRFYSNIRAYLDLGFQVQGIHVGITADGSEPSADLAPVAWSRIIEPVSSRSLAGRMLFRAGMPRPASLAYRLPQTVLVRREMQRRFRASPDAVFHLEGEWISSVIPFLSPDVRAIWSLHDLPSTVVEATIRIACESEQRAPTKAEQRELHFMRRMERLVAKRARLILCIAKHDSDRLRQEWGCERVEYLPMSIPGDGRDRNGGWLTDGRLRLLHLGRVAHLPSYRSLEFLLEQVFPRVPAPALRRMSMDVVGAVEPDNPRAKRILALAARYSNVSFRGFVANVDSYYSECDLQVVGSTDASGLRTRTIESFAYGLPVLSTSIGARGIAGLVPGEHLLIADDGETFAAQLARLTQDPARLEILSRRGRAFYLQHQSAPAVAASLRASLEKYLL